MTDRNNNGKDDAYDIAQFLKNTVEDIRDNVKELNINNNDAPTRKPMSDKTVRIIKRVIIVWLLLQFAPAVFGIVITLIALLAEFIQNVKFNADNETSHISTPNNLPLFEETAQSVISAIEKTIVDALEDIKNLFTIEGNVVLWTVLALIIGLFVIVILRAVTTKKGLSDEQENDYCSIQTDNIKTDEPEKVSEATSTECTNSDNNSDSFDV